MRYPRQNKILELISNQEIETQEKLAAMLKNEGFDVTQATISRDIKELQLIKVLSSTGKYKYAVSASHDGPISDRFSKIFRETIKSFASAQNLVIIKTLSGCGAAAGEAIDCLTLPHVVGSIAGDNTLLLIVDHEKNVDEVLAIFNDMLITRAKNQ
ncbi:MAG: arginine repressor [Peptostreptococcaceae bacterium]|nr:arginine repressor [Peptostreptococcaceae bacterium]MDY5738883.1 arginine repressor [Anaerovoracaceae bacterium]SFE39623.1 transcriptional regulator, ArgR family [Peptostreptococcaceae bacterium pGA-8]